MSKKHKILIASVAVLLVAIGVVICLWLTDTKNQHLLNNVNKLPDNNIPMRFKVLDNNNKLSIAVKFFDIDGNAVGHIHFSYYDSPVEITYHNFTINNYHFVFPHQIKQNIGDKISVTNLEESYTKDGLPMIYVSKSINDKKYYKELSSLFQLILESKTEKIEKQYGTITLDSTFTKVPFERVSCEFRTSSDGSVKCSTKTN